MSNGFHFLPEQASTFAFQVDLLYTVLWAITAFFTLLIFVLVAVLSIKYRRVSETPPKPTVESTKLELTYTVIPFIIVMGIFVWGVKLAFIPYSEPIDPLDVNVIGKQWMWKIQHPEGRREINELHVPVGRQVQLIIASQDVIHSFFVPAFRIKQDAVPGRTTKINFTPTKPGTYHLFCAEYCGTQHSGMVGKVTVMEAKDYEQWLVGSPADLPPREAGAVLFTEKGCITCHAVQAPTMAGLYMSRQPLNDGTEVVADEQYLRESILYSTNKIVRDYSPIMPSYREQLSEEQLMQLIEYIKSLKDVSKSASSDVRVAPSDRGLPVMVPPPPTPRQ